MADRYGFTGDVSFIGQDRYLAYYNGPAGQPAPAPLGGLGSVRPVLSGNFTGAPGKRVMREQSTRDRDGAMFASLGVRFAGPRYDAREVKHAVLMGCHGLGSVRDREICRTLATAGGQLASAIGTAASGPRPTQRSGESSTDFQRRLNEWETAQRLLAAAGGSAGAAATLCDLIDTGVPTPGPSGTGMSAYERALLERYAQQSGSQASTASSGVSTQTLLLGGGALVVAGVVAYLLLK